MDLLSRLSSEPDLWEKVLDGLVATAPQRQLLPATVLSLSQVSRALNRGLDDSNTIWEKVCKTIGDLAKTPETVSSILLKTDPAATDASARDRLRLSCFTGCMLCGKARIRKIYWQYKIRVCDTCLRDSSVSEYDLRDTYGIQLGDLCSLPSHKVGFYNPYKGAGTFSCFMWDDVLRLKGASSKTELRQLAERVEDDSLDWDLYTAIQKEGLRKRDVEAAVRERLPDEDMDVVKKLPSYGKAEANTKTRFSASAATRLIENLKHELDDLEKERGLEVKRQRLLLNGELADAAKQSSLNVLRHAVEKAKNWKVFKTRPEKFGGFQEELMKAVAELRPDLATESLDCALRCPACRTVWEPSRVQGLVYHYINRHMDFTEPRLETTVSAPKLCGCCRKERGKGHTSVCTHTRRTCVKCLRDDGGATRKERKVSLSQALEKIRVPLREDSTLCAAYISGKAGMSAEQVANIMARFKYLMEGYCPAFDDKVNEAEAQVEEMVEIIAATDGFYSGIRADARRELCRDGVLTSRREIAEVWDTFPDVWPWLK